MTLENPSQKIEGKFIEKFPHLHHLTEAQQEHFIVLHTHNEKREADDKKTEEQLLEQVYATALRGNDKKLVPQPHIGIDEELDHLHIQTEQEKAQSVKKITTNVVDFVPVVGSVKMILEGLRGKQYGTDKEIKGLRRVVHTVSGAVFLALDMTGVGAIGSEIGKGALKIGERMAVRKIEAAAEKELVEKTGEFALREIIEKEAGKLISRGEKRKEKQKKISRGPTIEA